MVDKAMAQAEAARAVRQTVNAIDVQRQIIGSLRLLGCPVDAAVGELNSLKRSLRDQNRRLRALQAGH